MKRAFLMPWRYTFLDAILEHSMTASSATVRRTFLRDFDIFDH